MYDSLSLGQLIGIWGFEVWNWRLLWKKNHVLVGYISSLFCVNLFDK